MNTLISAAIAIAFLVLVLALSRKSRTCEPDECGVESHPAPNTCNGRWLDLSERIFDASDVRWLRDELAFPKMAQTLTLERKRLAIRWLEALQQSFDTLVRTPALSTSDSPERASRGSWHMLWLTLRFKFLVSYALLVVKLFGPYHRLIPSLSWMSFSSGSGRSFQRASFAENRSLH
jgi:hypothetical protein